MRALTVIAILVAFLLMPLIVGGQQKNIEPMLEYGASGSFDNDNNGIAAEDSAIDFTVQRTSFNWDADDSNLCTRWQVIPDDSDFSTMLCYGAVQCCSLVELYPSSDNWNDDFYLFHDLYHAGHSNTVGAQIIHANYNLDATKDVDIAYSDFAYLNAEFIPAIPGIATQSTATATITSPDNSSALKSGEKVKLSITVDATATGQYSLDEAANATLEATAISGGTNLESTLQGNLPAKIINNSNHTLKIYIATASENITLDHHFTVFDNTAPSIRLENISNTTSIIHSTEAANISYLLNGILYATLLNSSNSALAIFNVTNGANNLTINATDMHGNTKSESYKLNVTIESCTDSVQNYHSGQQESGIDCGGSCSACVDLAVSTDKSTYLVNELVYIQVNARSDATHNITVTGPGYKTSLSYNGSTYYIISPTSSGEYTTNVTLKYRKLPIKWATATFHVDSAPTTNPLSASISTNQSTISVGDIVEFSAAASGNTSALIYEWDFNNDSVPDSSAQKLNYSYLSPGDYKVNLSVRDGTWNATTTKAVSVLPLYNITIIVKDRTTDSEIGAITTINGQQATSPYSLQLKKGDYPLTANYSGFLNYSSRVNIDRNETLVIYITTNALPLVTLTSPANGTVITANTTELSFGIDKKPLTCTLFVGRGGNLVQDKREMVNETAHTFSPSVSNGSYNWKVSCVDGAGNSGESETWSFTMSQLSQRDEEIRKEIELVTKIVDSAINMASQLSGTEKEVANAINYLKLLDNAKFELQRANRDIFNIKWRKLNTTAEEEFRNEIVNRIEIVKGNLTTNISAMRSADFVSYPSDATVEEISNEYSKGGLYTSEELRNYVSENIELQKLVSVTTHYTNVEFTKYNGLSIKGTLIQRRLTHNNLSGIAIAEFIPKSLANSAADIEVYSPFKVIRQDPIIELPQDTDHYAFLIKRQLTPVEVQLAETVLVKREVSPLPKKSSPLTGFAILNMEKLSSTKAVIAEIIILALLAGLYVFYGTGARESSNLKEVRKLMKKAGVLTEKEFAESERHYNDLSALFKKLEKKERAAIYPSLIELGSKIRRDHVLNKLRDIQVLIAHEQHNAARKVYLSISELYKSLPPHHRKDLYKDCSEVHQKLAKGK